MTSLPHPFLNHSDTIDIPKDRIVEVEEVYEWIKEQPNLPNYSKNHAYLFYQACVWDMAVTKRALQRYCQIRAGAPDIFGNRDPLINDIQTVCDMAQMVAMPETTQENYHILIYRLVNTDPSKLHFGHAVKAFCMFNDIRICEDGISDGYVVIFDMKGVRLGHLARVQFGPLRTFMAYIQDAHPARLKKIYIVNTSWFINQIMAIIKPLIRGELMNLLHFTSGPPSDIMPIELLPKEYGGQKDTLENIWKTQRHDMETIYRDWLIDSNNLIEVTQTKEKTKEKSCSDKQKSKNDKRAMLIEEMNDMNINAVN